MSTHGMVPDEATAPAAERPHDAAAQQEERRQRAVDSLVLREDAAHDRLDRITRMARIVFDVPLASITILDGDRAWYPSAQGFPGEPTARSETFCARAHDLDEVMVVPDATQVPDFADLPAVRDLSVRFYAGHPLRDHLGNVVGTFCIFDRQPRDLDAEQMVTFRDLAAWAQQELVASAEMSQAGQVQASLLPARAVRFEGWAVDGMCLPALAVGGDFYDFGVTNGVVHLGLGDVMGKGTGAALVGAGVRAALRGTNAAVAAGADLGITATQVARSLLGDLERAESFVTLFEAAIDLEDGYVRYVDAGAGLALLQRASGELLTLGSEDRPFGILPDDHWTEHETTMDPGDRLLVFSDGVLDLLDDPVDWAPEVGALLAQAVDLPSALGSIARLARTRTPLDDVTAVAVFRDPEA